MKKSRLLMAVLILLVGIQLIPVDRDNPPVTDEIAAPPELQEILERSCYDCHSNTTAWPWYSRVAPVSWLVARDVEEGRQHLNFSEWTSYSSEDRRELLEEIAEEVKGGEMPLWFYLPLHPAARLSSDDVGVVVQWASREIANPPAVGADEQGASRTDGEAATTRSDAPSGSTPSP